MIRLFSQCHDASWRPSQPREYVLEPWFVVRGWTLGHPETLEGRCFVPFITAG